MVVLCLLVSSGLFAKTDDSRWCGTHGTDQTILMIRMHERHQESLTPDQLRTAHINADVGNVAVIEGSATSIINANLFDLQGKKILFTENAGKYSMKVRGGSVSGTQGSLITLGDDDSKKVDFTSGFSFPFYGTTYTSVFVNSDGNLTFTEKDDASTPRDVFRTLEGPPRVAPFFADLNPSAGGEVRVLQSGTKFRVTWKNVPEFGTQNSNTFQITLFKNGNIQAVFSSSVAGDDAVTGISPGNTGTGQTLFVDYSKTNPVLGINNAVLERFASRKDLDFLGLIHEFLNTHPDVFDLITIFTDTAYLQGTGAFAFFSHVENHDKGIGLAQFDFSKFFGSKTLEGFLMMDNINKYPSDPNQTFLGTNSTLDIMGQENGHRWMAYPKAVIDGVASDEILGRDNAHWSWFLDSDGSDMEGNNWQDNGNGTFTSISATEKYSQLDRYLMGLIPSSQVPPFFVLRGAGDRAAAPQVNVTITATAKTVTINDVIAAEGQRVPSSATSQKKWRLGFIYFIQPGSNPDPANVAKVDLIRRKWQSYFRKATGGKGKLNTVLP